jgi:predicted dithiol-disulfide oxidoreductase (DUF899 family)
LRRQSRRSNGGGSSRRAPFSAGSPSRRRDGSVKRSVDYQLIVVHLNHRDVSFALVSRAPIATLEGYRQRMGWSIKWLSSLHTDFNRDYHVSFTPDEIEKAQAYYNYATGSFGVPEAPGISVFFRDTDGLSPKPPRFATDPATVHRSW